MKPKIQTYNHTPFALDELRALPILGVTISRWPGRRITLYQHPSQADQVVSEGVTTDGCLCVCAVESKTIWETALHYAKEGKVYTSE